ncbi:hypothetical protein WR25_01066 [Diploscapter pachys]|uniref:Uncharacterized protein n=1 Tax=Diploscapter pachys TaxID=2018661 RepID=A0A2A2JTE3_9BILA|nr:hypothetical protein WR25_01066 [Diploscapter pachys]
MERLEKFGRAIWKRVSGRRRRREQNQDTDTDKENQKTSKKQREKSPKKSEQKPWKTSQEVVFTTPAVAPMSRRVGKKAPTESSAEPVEVIFTAPDVRLKSGIKRGRPEESQKSERSAKVSVSPIPKKKESTPTKIEVPITVLGRSDIRSQNFVERDRTSDSEGYSTDASVLSSLPHLETFQQVPGLNKSLMMSDFKEKSDVIGGYKNKLRPREDFRQTIKYRKVADDRPL